MHTLSSLLCQHTYPGRGIVLGKSTHAQQSILAYFIMGRSENSRNRIFARTQDGIETKAFDPSKLTDPSLIIYHPVRGLENGQIIVTNGDQTDTIFRYISNGDTFEHALATRTFEPDEPNSTPRISALLERDGRYRLSILKTLAGDPSCCCRYFFNYDNPQPATGHFIHTYEENCQPLPSFFGEPRFVSLTAPDAATLAQEIWSQLNKENRVALYVRYTNLATGEFEDVIINRHEI